jgi:hypothetical protein
MVDTSYTSPLPQECLAASHAGLSEFPYVDHNPQSFGRVAHS